MLTEIETMRQEEVQGADEALVSALVAALDGALENLTSGMPETVMNSIAESFSMKFQFFGEKIGVDVMAGYVSAWVVVCAVCGLVIGTRLLDAPSALRAKKKKKIDKAKEEKVLLEHSDDKFIEALGGVENIESYELKGMSRLALVLKDYSKVNKEEIKRFYVSRILEMSNKIILVGENLKPLLEILDNSKSE